MNEMLFRSFRRRYHFFSCQSQFITSSNLRIQSLHSQPTAINKDTIDKSFSDFIVILNSNLNSQPQLQPHSNPRIKNHSKPLKPNTPNTSTENLWRTNLSHIIPSLNKTSYFQHLKHCQTNKNFNLLNSFLTKTHESSEAAAVIGTKNLIEYFLPFHQSENSTVVLQSLATHFSNWLYLMDKSIRPKQMILFLTTSFQRLFESNPSLLLPFYDQILQELIAIDSKRALETEEELSQTVVSSFILTTAQFLHNLNHSNLSSQLIQDALSKGMFFLSRLFILVCLSCFDVLVLSQDIFLVIESITVCMEI